MFLINSERKGGCFWDADFFHVCDEIGFGVFGYLALAPLHRENNGYLDHGNRDV